MRVNLDAAVGLWAVKVLQRWLQSMCDEQFRIDCDLEHVRGCFVCVWPLSGLVGLVPPGALFGI